MKRGTSVTDSPLDHELLVSTLTCGFRNIEAQKKAHPDYLIPKVEADILGILGPITAISRHGLLRCFSRLSLSGTCI